ncbi:MAG: hypothetical protein NBV77_01795 [Bacteroidia bacterium]|nr:hypothetical protein [Bacteroidia bacterium]
MKIKTITLLVFSLAALAVSTFTYSTNSEEDQVQNRIMNAVENLHQLTSNWQILKFSNQEVNWRLYLDIRKKYKSIEAYVSFRYPELEKSINGGPVPGIVTDFITLKEEEPHGLQVMEEMIDDNDSIGLEKECYLLIKNISYLEKSFKQFNLKTWEIFEANHQIISRLMSLGLTGFDSPVRLNAIADATSVLESLKWDLSVYQKWGNNQLVKFLDFQIAKSLEYLKQNWQFDDFNRVAFYRDLLVPIQINLRRWQISTQIELYEETNAPKRAINTKGEHLFDPNYLNPYFSSRGSDFKPDSNQIALGKKLFFDVRLSAANNMSCATCHDPKFAYADTLKKSFERNSPSLINVGFQGNFFWDLRSDDINNQVHHVVHHPNEFNTNATELVSKIASLSEYNKWFERAFPNDKNPLNYNHLKLALEQFVRSLIAVNSKFDRYMRSEKDVKLTSDEIAGANLFLGKAACATCHFAPLFNGYVPPNYGESEGEILGVTTSPNSIEIDPDFGKYELFKAAYPDAHFIKGMFKTPGIRNVDKTAPYMHNGAFATLEEVMDFYNHGGAVGKGLNWTQQTLSPDSLNLNSREISQIIAFMKTLSDDLTQ